MISEENIILRKERDVLLEKQKKITKYYIGKYNKSYTQIQQVTPISRPKMEQIKRMWS